MGTIGSIAVLFAVFLALWFVGYYIRQQRGRATADVDAFFARLFGSRKQETVWIIGLATVALWAFVYFTASDEMKTNNPLSQAVKDTFEEMRGGEPQDRAPAPDAAGESKAGG